MFFIVSESIGFVQCSFYGNTRVQCEGMHRDCGYFFEIAIVLVWRRIGFCVVSFLYPSLQLACVGDHTISGECTVCLNSLVAERGSRGCHGRQRKDCDDGKERVPEIQW